MKQVGLSRTTFEQRAPLYVDVEALLDFGFLTHNLSINGVPFSLRSLGPGDRFMLRHRAHNLPQEEWAATAIATSLWMANGYNLLNEDNAIPMMKKIIMKMPPNVRAILFNEVGAMFDRVNDAMEAVESYAYEKASRYKWRSLGGQPFHSHNGLKGNIGTNHVQRMWTFYNMIEDQRVADEVYWDGVKFATSAHSAKGVKKADDKDKQHRKDEQDRRQRVQDTFFYTVKGVVKKVEPGAKAEPKLNGQKTSDDLAEEMRRWVAGEADWHDDIVNNYKRMVSENYERHKQEAADRAAILATAREDDSGQTQPMVAYTPEQLADILKDRGHGVAGVRQVGTGPQVVREHLYTKFLGREADSGVLQVTPDGQMAIVAPDARPSLDQQIEGRNVVFRTGVDEDDPREPLPSEW